MSANLWERTQAGLDAFDALSSTDLERRQLERFISVFEHHRRSSACYRRLLEEHGLAGDWLPRSLGEVSAIPLVDKAFLRAGRYDETPNTSEPVTIVSTSGTTSTAARIPHNEESLRSGLGENFARAIVLGGLGDNRWSLIGHWDADAEQSKLGLTGSFLSMAWLAENLDNAVLFRNGALGLGPLVSEVVGFGPTAMASSPNLLAAIARGVLEVGGSVRLGGMLYGGAAATQTQRELWAEAFDQPEVVAFYPTTDAGALGVSPADDGSYLTFAETHLIEVVGAAGAHVGVGERGRIVVTSFGCDAAPLVRYQVGDDVTYSGVRNGRVCIAQIERSAEVAIGDGLLPLSLIAGWADELLLQGHSVGGLQLVLRRAVDGRDRPIIRIHNALEESKELEMAALGLCMAAPQLANEVAQQTVIQPVVEFVSSRHHGQFKVSPHVDERTSSGPDRGLRT